VLKTALDSPPHITDEQTGRVCGRKGNEPDRAPRSLSRGRDGRCSVGDDVPPRFVVRETDSNPLAGSLQKRSRTKKEKGRSPGFPSWSTKWLQGVDLNF
jgi:hypothetical protein